jgi:excisionase family DNA binding protein
MSNTITVTQELSADSLELIRKIIVETLSLSSQTNDDGDTLLKIDGAASLLGVSEDSIRSYVRAKYFPAYKKGKILYFSKQEITTWIKSGTRKPGVRFRANKILPQSLKAGDNR